MILNFIAAAVLLMSTGLPDAPDENIMILKNMSASYGAFEDRIVIQWKHDEENSYRLLRSNYKDKDFIEIAVTEKTEYEDKEIIPGVKYWYRVSLLNPKKESKSIFKSISRTLFGKKQFISEDEYTAVAEPDTNEIWQIATTNIQDNDNDNNQETDYPVIVSQSSGSSNYSGYAIPAKPEGENLDRLMAMKKDKIKNPSTKDQQQVQNKRLNYLKQYYMNKVKFSLILVLAKPYLKDGELLIFTDLNNYTINTEEKQVTFYAESSNYSITFESGKLLRVLNESNDQELQDLLLKNAELFCVPSGKKEYRGEDGITRIIYTYDAVGLTTRYLKNDAQWKSKTIMMATARADLKKQLMEASQPLEGF